MEYTKEIMGEVLTLTTSEKLFSPQHADWGTLAMLRHVSFEEGQKVLDLGCGAGLVGILAAKKGANVTMLDVDPEAVDIARSNAERNHVQAEVLISDGFRDLDDAGFDLILTNPPYQSDFAVAKHFIEKGFNRLRQGGKMLMVTKRLDWYRNRFRAIFGGVQVIEDDGYYVFIAERRSLQYAGVKKKK